VDALARAIVYVGLLLLVGGGVYRRWVAPEGTESVQRLAAPAGIGLILASLLEVAAVVQRLQGGLSLPLLLDYLLGTRHGLLVLVRSGAALILTGLEQSGLDGPRARFAYATGSVVALATLTWTAHAASAGTLPLLADLAHLSAAVAWGGALLYLSASPLWRDSGEAVRRAVRRLSALGLWAVLALLATGVYAITVHVWGWPVFRWTDYGRALGLKLGFVALVWLVAAVNRWRLLPAMDRPEGLRTLRRSVRIEAALLLGVLGATGLLTTQPPPERVVLRAPTAFEERVGGVRVRGEVLPSVGGFSLTLEIRPPVAGRVEAEAVMLGHPMAPVAIPLRMRGPGRFGGQAVVPMAGPWQITIRVGGRQLDVPLVLWRAPSPAWTLPDERTVAAGVLVATGVLLMGVGARQGARTPRGRSALVAGVAALGIGVAVRTVLPRPLDPITLRNPIPPTANSVALGARLYRENCAVCHGPEGRGDGPAAPSLVPRPADLTVHAPMHTDGELFWWITNGLPGTAMPAFRDRLTEPERWHIVNFLRTLAPQER